MNKYCLSIVLAFSVSLLVVAYGLSSAAEAEPPAVVSIEGSAFSPEAVTIKVGGEVLWRNKDAATHTVTADDGSFDSGSLSQGAEFRRKFTKAGTIKYSCDIHAYMGGKIEVK